ncbi:diguanylate cyclase domain-containing protein [Methylococcus sp. EFPC2]|uniref:GGDEF domain-containing protein n=1 Tax=Methylococcus sp. EFPC2 TaxID=2812648 RepID=UPI001967DB77|nr:diguanylate cyclase [Methylococcus sp. EFPC2]QSA95881.1 diguanylate cyclase [Methylococcus sp. EFPC2]
MPQLPSADPELILNVLDQAPLGVVLVRARRILWLNERLAETLRVAPDALAGKQREELPAGLASLLDEQAEELTLTLADGARRHLRRRRVILPAWEAEVYYFDDITDLRALEAERERLQILVDTLDNRDGETGLKNRNAILLALENQISRSRRYGNPFSVIRLRLVPPAGLAEPGQALGEISREFNSQLRWADDIGRLDAETLLLILPETTQRDAEDLTVKLGHERVALASRAEGWFIDFAVTDWRQGDDARKLLDRVCASDK